MRTHHLRRYRYSQSGQNDNFLGRKVIKMITFDLLFSFFMFKYRQESMWGDGILEKEYLVPRYITAGEIKETRKALKLSQEEFAELLGCSKPTVVRWENGKENITGPIVTAVYALKESGLSEKIVLPKMKFNLRLKYYYKQYLCTLIDVDEANERLEITNYTNKIMFCAFGSLTNPTYADYEEFLESRCFPRTRDKMKIVLEDIGVPFYDPMMIIEKTKGKMAEDDFWIEVVRK